ncbi:hypothetical protein [Hathewaya limosa]|uniref:Cell division protein FtsB n=1 Tax=Hathewaya limosa TaxID=1536 RepID=A0ABU0JRU1_HATLI|nr:hypothetical protein [Hathewaya limosa]MDQ0478632.1 cell division protein FtsB [Hathewaya limosa]
MNKKNVKVTGGILAGITMFTGIGVTPVWAQGNSDTIYNNGFKAMQKAKNECTQEYINKARLAIKEMTNHEELQFAVGEFSKQVDVAQQKLFQKFYNILYTQEKGKITLKKSLTQEEVNKARGLVKSFATYEGNKAYISSWSSAVDNFQQKIYNDSAAKVIQEINNLPSPCYTELKDEEVVNKATENFNALSKEVQALVTNYSKLKQSQDVIKAYKEAKNSVENDFEVAEKVFNEIKSLPSKENIKISDKDDISKARKDYDKLTNAQKSLVGDITKLIDLEESVNNLK